MAEGGLLPPPLTMQRRRRPAHPGDVRHHVPAETTERLDHAQASSAEDRSLRIALLAPPWRPVAPSSEGEVERALARLADALVAAGHEVTLYAAPGSRTRARAVPVLDRAHERETGSSMVEADHTARAFAAIERAELDGAPFDVVHDHSGWTALAMADRLAVPFVHTVHGPFDEAAREWYRAHGAKAAIVCRSEAHAAGRPAGMRLEAVVPNPVEVTSADRDDFLLWAGRVAPGTGADLAVRVARAAGRPLVFAGAVEPRAEAYPAEAHVEHVAAVRDLLPRARALLMPATWEEPFGAIMAEAMGAGTPVIAPPRGSAPELIDEGLTGLLAGDEAALAAAVERIADLDPERCRAQATERFGPRAVAERYAAVYQAAVRPLPGPGSPAARPAPTPCARAASWRRPRPAARH